MTLLTASLKDLIARAHTYLDSDNKAAVGMGEAGDFAEALVRIAHECVCGLPCERHGLVHGQEARELRSGIEQILRSARRGEFREQLHDLLDRVDARDSSSFQEAPPNDLRERR